MVTPTTRGLYDSLSSGEAGAEEMSSDWNSGGPEEAVGSQGPEMRVGALVRVPCHPPQNVKGSSSWQYCVLSFDGMWTLDTWRSSSHFQNLHHLRGWGLGLSTTNFFSSKSMIFLPLPFHKSSRSKWRHEVARSLLWVSLLITLGSDCEPSSAFLSVCFWPHLAALWCSQEGNCRALRGWRVRPSQGGNCDCSFFFF